MYQMISASRVANIEWLRGLIIWAEESSLLLTLPENIRRNTENSPGRSHETYLKFIRIVMSKVC